MKKALLILTAILGLTCRVGAQDDGIKYTDGSFRDRADVVNSLSESGMGAQDLAPTTYFQQQDGKFLLDENGDPTNAAVVIFIKNMPLPEFANVRVNVEGAQITNPTRRTINGREAIVVHVRGSESGRKYNRLTVNHPQYGTGTLLNPVFKTRHIYEVEFINSRRTNVSINTNPPGMRVIFDGKEVAGTTPVTIQNVGMGEHEVEIPSNGAMTFNLKERIEVDDAHTAFAYDLRKQRNVTFRASRKNARIEVYDPLTQQCLGRSTEAVVLQELPFGVYKVVAYLDNKKVYDENLTVDQHSPDVFPISVVKKKSVNFTAFQNNRELTGAVVSIKGEGDVGHTPLTREMEYDTYSVTMSSGGKHKTGKLRVDDNSSPIFELVLPNPYHYRSRWNPFDIDYNKREWGFAMNYINRQWLFKVKQDSYSNTTRYSSWEEGGSDNGIQLGIAYTPYFGYGQGLVTGLYWQMFFNSMSEFDGEPTWFDHALYIPLQYQFRLPLHEDFSIYVNGGIACTIGLANELDYGDDGGSLQLGYGHNDEYGTYMHNRVQWAAPVGGGLQWKAMVLDFKYAFGLNDNKDMYTTDEGITASYKMRTWQIGLHLMF